MNKHAYSIRFNNSLAHSKGPWKKHKYIKKVGNRYYYKNSGDGSGSRGGSDLSSMSDKELYNYHKEVSEQTRAAGEEMDANFDVLVDKYGLQEGKNGSVRGLPVTMGINQYVSSPAEKQAYQKYNDSLERYEEARSEKVAAEKEMQSRGSNRYNTAKRFLNR